MADKVTTMLLNIVHQCTSSDLKSVENIDVKEVLNKEIEEENSKQQRKEKLKNKIRLVGKTAMMLKDLRENQQKLLTMNH